MPRERAAKITRLRLGYTRLTEVHKFGNSYPPDCPHCEETLDIDHMLLTPCDYLEQEQQQHRVGPLDEHRYFDNVVSYMKVISVYPEI